MKNSTKILLTALILGFIYAIFKLFTGQGGSGLYDFFDAIVYSSIVLFFTSLIILVINIRRLRTNPEIFIFLIVALPLTISASISFFQNIKYNRKPDLTAPYPRPINKEHFNFDSLNVKCALDSLVVLENRNSNSSKILYAFIDTIIYSQKGDKILVMYIMKYAENNYGNNFVSSALFADKKDSIFWTLEKAKLMYSGDFNDSITLKNEVRKFYFNQFCFADKDSLKENYFWRKMNTRTNTIIVN